MNMNARENERKKKFADCAACGAELKDSYYTFTEEMLPGRVFFELDGSDNAFCCKDCACEMLSLTKEPNIRDN